MEHLLDPDYYPVKRLNQQLIEVSGLIDKCQNQKAGNSVVLIGNRSLGPASIVNEAIKTVTCPVVWLNGQLLSDSNSILKHLSWKFSHEFPLYEKFGDFLESYHSQSPIIFILEDIDRFAMIPGQNLLYTLFEAPSNQRLPVLIIGLTSRYEFVSLLEKRVKSRFSQYCIGATEQGLNFNSYSESVLEALCNAFNELQTSGRPRTIFRNALTKAFDDAEVKSCVQMHFMHTPNLHNILAKLIPIFQVPKPTSTGILRALKSGQSSLESLVENWADPLLAILVALSRINAKNAGVSRVNFEMVLKEFEEMHRQGDQNDLNQCFAISRERLQLAWFHLVEIGVLKRNPNSLIEADIDLLSISEPFSNLHDSLPKGCPDYLKRLAILD